MKRTATKEEICKMSEITSGVLAGDGKKLSDQLKGGDAKERIQHRKEENMRLRECVLNRLWDSLPPETQFQRYSTDEDLDSDSTESGLDEQGGEHENDSLKKGGKQLPRDETEATAESPDIFDSDSSPDEEDDSSESWNINFDFIQAIIWLTSITSKLQRVPADDVLKVFKNQWELNGNIKPSQLLQEEKKATKKRDSSYSGTAPSDRKRLKYLNDCSNGSFIVTKQREQADSIRNRLSNNFKRNGPKVVIPESDESETDSPKSSENMPERTYPVLDFIEFHSTVDSGFNSEKPESAEVNTEPNFTPKKKSKNFVAIARKTDSGIAKRGRRMKKRNQAASKQPGLFVSSATLNYVLRSSECNKLLVKSVRAILNGLKGIESSASGLRINWHGSVQQEGIQAVVSVVDQLEKEKGSILCRDAAVATVRKVLQNMLDSNEGDKRTAWEHHRLLILELCNASSVCTEVINYLILELEKLIPVVRQTCEKNTRTSLGVLNKSYLLFHSLRITLTKYTSFPESPVRREEKNSSEKIPEITEFWKRHLTAKEKEPDIFAAGLERLENDEEGWMRVLEELVVASTTTWPMVKVLAWQCLALLKSHNLNVEALKE